MQFVHQSFVTFFCKSMILKKYVFRLARLGQIGQPGVGAE